MRRLAVFLALLLITTLIALPAAAQTETPTPTEPPAFTPCAEATAEPDVTATPIASTCAHLTATLSQLIDGGLADWYLDGLLAGSQVANLDMQVTASKSHKIEARNIGDPAANGVYQWLMSYATYAYLQPGAEKATTVVIYKKYLKGFLRLKCAISNLQSTEDANCLPTVDGVALDPIAQGQAASIPLDSGKHVLAVNAGPSGAWIAVAFVKTVYIYIGTSSPVTASLTLLHGAPPNSQPAKVISVVDGDTLDVSIDGVKSRVHYIGINAPESNQVCGYTATQANRSLVGKSVALMKDVSDTDTTGRLLRYVYGDNVFVNAELVKRGFALAVDTPPDTAFSSTFHPLQDAAQAANLGCWQTSVWVTPTAPPPSAVHIGPGTYLVGSDIQPGIYKSQTQTCYWERLNALTGDLDAIIANDFAKGPAYVEVQSSDYAFHTTCSMVKVEQPFTPAAVFPDNLAPGMYLVNVDIRPGTYQGQAGSDFCYWERLKDVSGDLSSILANDFIQGQFYVAVQATDFAIKTTCALVRVGD